jgi:hypothetical protein
MWCVERHFALLPITPYEFTTRCLRTATLSRHSETVYLSNVYCEVLRSIWYILGNILSDRRTTRVDRLTAARSRLRHFQMICSFGGTSVETLSCIEVLKSVVSVHRPDWTRSENQIGGSRVRSGCLSVCLSVCLSELGARFCTICGRTDLHTDRKKTHKNVLQATIRQFDSLTNWCWIIDNQIETFIFIWTYNSVVGVSWQL